MGVQPVGLRPWTCESNRILSMPKVQVSEEHPIERPYSRST